MKILLDASIGPSVGRTLSAAGHDVVRVRTDIPDPGDDAILERAAREARVIVTADKDFGELVFDRRRAHAGIVRVVDHPLARHPATVHAAITQYADALTAGAIVTIEPGRVRVRTA